MGSSFEVLNKILEGEHIAIAQYQACIDALAAGPFRNHLTALLTDHKNHATRLAYYIQTNGGHVREGAGLMDSIVNWKNRIGRLAEAKPEEILEHLYTGEDKGLARAEQFAEQSLTSAEKEVLEPILAEEHDHLKQLQKIKEGLFYH
ncbi:ferritin-like domain-containing protein [Desulfosporosinus sp. PR]|uniref:ferritin-like domain-containing protein n=1 Tax=Candidatus Desulfosporosinus nitrosoreducens TaxID=3401928 RepID=UPI0027F76773|nr:ferritin-like domain-containing protein [Desulfosporosinus sp. PR]MDQ7093950.1 ferritin-like domain-containing protein [Desulfosporosinus sp. PR]